MFWNKKNKLHLIDTSQVSRIEQQEIKRLFARVFSTQDGQKVIAYLQHLTYQRNLSAESSNELLRFAEGQRALVSTIQNFIQQGKSN